MNELWGQIRKLWAKAQSQEGGNKNRLLFEIIADMENGLNIIEEKLQCVLKAIEKQFLHLHFSTGTA
jgi:hypothetical protein